MGQRRTELGAAAVFVCALCVLYYAGAIASRGLMQGSALETQVRCVVYVLPRSDETRLPPLLWRRGQRVSAATSVSAP